jgi:DNA-directed RNA polymerase specialized sigma24 family protein
MLLIKIAETLDISCGMVKIRHYKALELLRSSLE